MPYTEQTAQVMGKALFSRLYPYVLSNVFEVDGLQSANVVVIPATISMGQQTASREGLDGSTRIRQTVEGGIRNIQNYQNYVPQGYQCGTETVFMSRIYIFLVSG